MEIAEETIDPPPALTPDNVSKYIQGVAKLDEKLVMLLDSGKIVAQKDFEQIT